MSEPGVVAVRRVLPLLVNGPLLVTGEFCTNKAPSPPLGAVVVPSGEGELLRTEPLRQLSSLMKKYPGKPSDSDGEAAVLVHRALPLTRRQAAEPKFWHYCAVSVCCDYVAWRWAGESKPVPAERYLGRWERNAIARLWWLAELTWRSSRSGTEYENTLKAGRNQEFALWTVDAFASASSPVLDALVEVAFEPGRELTGDQVRALFKAVTAVRATLMIDVLDREAVHLLVRSIAENIR